MTSDFLLEEQIIEDGLNKYLNEFKEDTTKSRSPIVTFNHFSFNSQGIFFIHILIFKLMNSFRVIKIRSRNRRMLYRYK